MSVRSGTKKLVVAVAAVACAMVFAPSAFSHATGFSVSGTCNTVTGNYDLSWTVGPTDWLSYTPQISASNRAAIPVGTALTTQYVIFTESVPGTTTSVSAAITVRWTRDGYTQTRSTGMQLAGNCAPAKKDPQVATTIHSAAHAPVTSVVVGTTVHDSATVSGSAGTPTGTVTFKWFTNDTCTGAEASRSGALPLSSGTVDATSFTQTPAVGAFAFQAVYSGDGKYNGKTGPCEPLSVTKADPVVVTTIHTAAHGAVTSVVAGTPVHDSAAVSGSAGTPTGSVTFEWFTNISCSQSPVATSAAFQLSNGSVDGTTFVQTPGAAGGFAFRALYSGDNTYASKTGPCEPLAVTSPSTPTPTPTPTPTATPSALPLSADVAIQKDATAQVRLGTAGKASIAYDLRLQNAGPGAAADVMVDDPAPSGVTFDRVTQQPSQGSCSIESKGAILHCSLGTLAAGQSVVIRVGATVTVTGTITNTATTTTTTIDTNPKNNHDDAQTLVVAALAPPRAPKAAKAVSQVCKALVVTPKMLKANGNRQAVNVKVTRAQKGVAGVAVRITGPGIDRTARTGSSGKVRVMVRPGTPGIIRVEIRNEKACNSQRIGVVGIYEPPVTG